MTAHHHKDLIAWQLADAFKREIFRLVKNSSPASRNLRYHDQIVNAASDVGKDIVEGFGRKAPLEFAKFLDYAVASLAEAEGRLTDGIQLSYFDENDCALAFRFAKRCFKASVELKKSQIRYAEQQKRERQTQRRRKRRI